MDQFPINLKEHEGDSRDTIEGIFCNLFMRNKEQMTCLVVSELCLLYLF